MLDQWRIWLGRLVALAALACGIIGLIVGLSDDLTWKLGMQGWFAGGTVVALISIIIHMEETAAARSR